ncbi:MAG: DUF4089 domain-containing protein [Luteitalea sp.]|nr:DUF4089 domain-containing protein [Luteitalea sp.]
MTEPTKELVKSLAAANGLEIPDERLELVLRQYERFMRTMAELDTLPLPRETEPAILYSLTPPAATPPESGR